MARQKNTDGTIGDLGVLITAAYDLDTSWMKRGSCYNWGSQRPGHPTPWQVAPGKRYNGVTGYELVKYALINCLGCEAQYDCATYAIEAKMIAGTWSMPITQLKWMQSQEDALDLVAMAREMHAPMQEVASLAFFERTQPA